MVTKLFYVHVDVLKKKKSPFLPPVPTMVRGQALDLDGLTRCSPSPDSRGRAKWSKRGDFPRMWPPSCLDPC